MAKKADNLVKVTPTGQPICEDGIHYQKGDVLETTPERADALGGLVEPVKPA